MNLHEALIIFGLDYSHYTQQDIDQAYTLCKEIAPEWQAELNKGKKALEDALQPYTFGAIKLAELRQGIYVPSPDRDARKPSSWSYDEIHLFKFPDFNPRMELFSSFLIPLLDKVSEPLSVNDPQLVPPSTTGHLTVVLDLDETLLQAREGPIRIRHYARTLLKTLSELEDANGQPAVELILFSAADKQHVDSCRRVLDPQNKLFKHSICKGSWINSSLPLKDISLLGRRSCLLVDDSAYATVKNGHRALLIPVFRPEKHYHAANDKTLLYVLEIVTRVSHILSRPEPIAHPVPRFGRKYTLEMPTFCNVLDTVSKKRHVFAESKNAIDPDLALKQARHAKISTQLAEIKVKIEAHAQPNGQFTAEAVQVLLQDRLFTTAVNAVRTKMLSAEAAKYVLRIALEVGEMIAADLIADSPFAIVAPILTISGIILNCLCLDVTNTDALGARIQQFLTKQKEIIEIHQAEMASIAIHAAQISAAQLLAVFTEAQVWWGANEESALTQPQSETALSDPEKTAAIPVENGVPPKTTSTFFKLPSPICIGTDTKDKKTERVCGCC